MIEEIYEPVTLFRDSLKETHATNTSEFFEELVRRSGVDEAANAAKVNEIHKLDSEIGAHDGSEAFLRFVRKVFWLVAVACVICIVVYALGANNSNAPFSPQWAMAAFVGAAGSVFAVFFWLNPRIKTIREALQSLKEKRSEMINEALLQMAPLNRLYDWDMPGKLVQKTVPLLQLDPYMTNGRLEEIRRTFGWSDRFNTNKSVLCTLSGQINGNPFVVAETLDFSMGAKTYRGSKSISWRERQTTTDAQGRRHTSYVTKRQTLSASVTKPAPEHYTNKVVIYGNEAAPTLRFSRSPSSFSDDGGGLLDKWRKSREIKELEKFSRNLDDDSGFTMMSNKDFEVLFHAIDRNDDVQFRLLFTPLAQRQMVTLLKDKSVGYGDDFAFVKDNMINMVWPQHLSDLDLAAHPLAFHSYDLAAARRFFNDFNNDYFRSFFFAMAPVLTIPLYQQHRSHSDIYKDVYSRSPSFWEHETIANIHGQDEFKHHLSATPNILKTVVRESRDDVHLVEVTAYGFRTERHTEFVDKFGGDGNWHQVPVDWVEYLPVSRTSSMAVRESDGLSRLEYQDALFTPQWQDFFNKWDTSPARTLFRRTLMSFIESRA